MNANSSPLQSSADGPVTVPAALSPLSQLHPGHAGELARFFVLEAGWSPEDLEGFDGDPEFTTEVQAAMADILAGGTR